jgi:predicted P-loop ATPase
VTAPSRAAEEYVIGAVLLDPARWRQVEDLTLSNFHWPEHRAIWQTLTELAANGGIRGLAEVVTHLESNHRLEIAGGAAALERLREDTPTAVTISHYADKLRAFSAAPAPPAKVTRHGRAKPLPRPAGEPLNPDGSRDDTSGYVTCQGLGLEFNANGQAHPSLGNVSLIVERHPELAGKIWLDTFRGQIWHSFGPQPQPWTDADALRLTAWINSKLKQSKIGLKTVQHAVELVAANHRLNSVTAYLESLTWDGTPRLEHWLADCLGVARTAYTVAVARNWPISMVARAYRPGCQVDHMPVLEGLSGAGKSSALRVLGGPWYKAAPQAFGSKAFLEAIQGAWLTEIPDMVGFERREHSHIISALTTCSDVYRASYGRIAEDHPRTTVFAATSETSEYLEDARGRRRYWPLTCTEINLELLTSIRDQLFAEATVAFKAGATWHEMPAEEADIEQRNRLVDDPWTPKIAHFVKGKLAVTVSEIVTDCLYIEPSKQDRSVQMRVSKILKNMRFTCKVERDGESTGRVYRPPAVTRLRVT